MEIPSSAGHRNSSYSARQSFGAIEPICPSDREAMSEALYFNEIELFPLVLQSSSAVLYAIVKSIERLHCNTITLSSEECDANEPVTQANESVLSGRCSSILEHFDHVGRRLAQSAFIAGESKGIR